MDRVGLTKLLVKDITVSDDVTISGDWSVTGNCAITGTFEVTSTSTFTGAVSIDDTTDTTSGVTGSLHTDGGIGIAKAFVRWYYFCASGGCDCWLCKWRGCGCHFLR